MATNSPGILLVPSELRNASESSGGGGGGGGSGVVPSSAGDVEENEGQSPAATQQGTTQSLTAPAAGSTTRSPAATAQPERSPTASARSPAAATERTSRGFRSSAAQAFPALAPAYGGNTAEQVFGAPPLPPTATASISTTFPRAEPPSATTTTLGSAFLPPTPTPLSPPPLNHPGPPGRSTSSFSERPSVTARRAAEAQAALEKLDQVEGDIGTVEGQVLVVKRTLDVVQEAFAAGGSYLGKKGAALVQEEERLGWRERLLREQAGQLREERLLLLRSQNPPRNDPLRRGSEGRQKRVSFIMTQTHVDDPSGELAEQRRVSQVEEKIVKRRQSLNGGAPVGDEAGNDSVFHVYKIEEDPRLLVRINAYNLPILVATLLSGFTLVLFDVAKTDLARRLAVLAFAVEMSASTMLCLIVFRGQQLYARATNIDQLTRGFLRKVDCVTILSLALFSIGMMVFVVGFAVEASEEMGAPWMAVLAVVLCPTITAGVMFAWSTMLEARRKSWLTNPPAGLEQTE